MPHLNTKPGQHDPTVSAFIIRTDTPEPCLMLHKHKSLGVYLQFGGHVEYHENPWQAVTHEIEEESGYKIGELKLLQPKIRIKKISDFELHPMPVRLMTHRFAGLDHYHSDTAFAFIADHKPTKNVAKGESEDIRLFTAHELRTLDTDKIPENVRETGLHILEQLMREWDIVII